MNLRDYALALLSALAFSIFSILGKPFLANIRPELASGLAYLSAGIVLLAFFLFQSRKKPLLPNFGRDTRLLVLSLFIGSMAAPSLFFHGLSLLPATTTAFLSNFEVLFTVVLAALFFHERLKGKVLLPIAVIFLGAVLVTTNGNLNFQMVQVQGAFFVLLGCLFWAIDNNLVRILMQRIELIQMSLVKSFFGGLVLVCGSMIFNFRFNLESTVVFLFLGILLAISIVSYFSAIKSIGAARTISVYSVYSLFGAILAVFFLGETISFTQFFAGLTMLGGVLLLTRS